MDKDETDGEMNRVEWMIDYIMNTLNSAIKGQSLITSLAAHMKAGAMNISDVIRDYPDEAKEFQDKLLARRNAAI
jgi:hypothetical protein